MNIYTDIAREAAENLGDAGIPGISVREQDMGDDISICRVHVKDDSAEKAIGKSKGRYITVEFPPHEIMLPETAKKVKEMIAVEIASLLPAKAKDMAFFVIGLGNKYVTPDSLGPKVCDRLFVTRHIKRYLPEAIDERAVSVSAIAAGVLAATGIETFEIAESIIKKTKPDVLIAVDALAAGSISRIGTTVQISDAGIAPGSGIGNKRTALNSDSLGIPVIAVGVPTVVYAKTIAEELVHNAALSADPSRDDVERLIGILQDIDGSDLVVTPKNVDKMTDDAASIVAYSLNRVMHSEFTDDEIAAYMS